MSSSGSVLLDGPFTRKDRTWFQYERDQGTGILWAAGPRVPLNFLFSGFVRQCSILIHHSKFTQAREISAVFCHNTLGPLDCNTGTYEIKARNAGRSEFTSICVIEGRRDTRLPAPFLIDFQPHRRSNTTHENKLLNNVTVSKLSAILALFAQTTLWFLGTYHPSTVRCLPNHAKFHQLLSRERGSDQNQRAGHLLPNWGWISLLMGCWAAGPP